MTIPPRASPHATARRDKTAGQPRYPRVGGSLKTPPGTQLPNRANRTPYNAGGTTPPTAHCAR